jgi:two-component system, NarL family, response regulator
LIVAQQPFERIRVLLVEDNFYTRLGTATFLRGQPGIDVVGEASDGSAGLALFTELTPDVTLVDLRMPSMDGIALIAAVRTHSPDARVLVLTHHRGDENVLQAVKAGARGYLTKEAPGDDLVAALRAVSMGDRYFPREIARVAANGMTRPHLTRRERQVLDLVADGASNRETGNALGIAERTVSLYVSSILSKLGARSRTEAVSLAVHQGIIQSSGG